ncbi:MAG: class I SAM-dependent methyltransferase [Bacteroidetes bacterium]|nr:class I SAM-dependent methyltransferase [Bacteroidota bacterium]MBS1629248.1 class I SAM-dependent methyltransferase [Bacteroidota bacterium]
MSDANWFERWFGSPYYSILYQHRDELEAEEFVANLIRYFNPQPGSRMFDIACGEGRFAIELADQGFDVTGIDLSHRSILKAKESEQENLHFYVHDMRMPLYVNYFDYAFNFFTSFGYFAYMRDHQLAAKSFAKGLKKGGTLVLDYLNSERAMRRMKAEDSITREGYTFHIRKRIEEGHFLKEISFTDANGQTRNYTERVAAFGLNDFEHLFQNAGMTLAATFGNYHLDAFDADESPRLIMVFKK